MINLLRLIYFIPIWALFTIVAVPFVVLGLVVIPISLLRKDIEFRQSKYFLKLITAWGSRLMWLWGNEEDGLDKNGELKDRIFYWTALRNPVNNHRFVKYVGCRINPDRVRFIGSYGSVTRFLGFTPSKESEFYLGINRYDTKTPQWFLAWQGIYSNFYLQFAINRKLYRAWVGWKIFPTDIFGVTPYRKYGAGFVYQLKRVR